MVAVPLAMHAHVGYILSNIQKDRDTPKLEHGIWQLLGAKRGYTGHAKSFEVVRLHYYIRPGKKNISFSGLPASVFGCWAFFFN